MIKRLLLVLNFFSILLHGLSQQKNLAEKLGHARDAKLLIVHADDIGVAHSVNAASIAAFEQKGINSGSIMVPCPWFPEIAAYVKEHPELDLGIHVTLTAEWKNYKWGGVLPSNEIPSLLNKEGYFYASVEEFVQNAKLPQVEKEVRAQIDRALAFGIKPTHLDSHMGSLFASPELFKLFQKIGRDYRIPVLIPMNMITRIAPQFVNLVDTNQVIVDQFFSLFMSVPPDEWSKPYNNFIQSLVPGLNQIIVHLAYDNEEMQAITIEHPEFGSAWRQRDFNYITSEKFKTELKRNKVQLVTWREIQNVPN
jgi:predicted glycoside hydrolase/deacetylase ChbG (UPF0249 family)